MKTCRPKLGPQPPMRLERKALYLGLQRPEREVNHSPPSSTEDKNECSYIFTSHVPTWRVRGSVTHSSFAWCGDEVSSPCEKRKCANNWPPPEKMFLVLWGFYFQKHSNWSCSFSFFSSLNIVHCSIVLNMFMILYTEGSEWCIFIRGTNPLICKTVK